MNVIKVPLYSRLVTTQSISHPSRQWV